jgi:hypothetical protein
MLTIIGDPPGLCKEYPEITWHPSGGQQMTEEKMADRNDYMWNFG